MDADMVDRIKSINYNEGDIIKDKFLKIIYIENRLNHY